MATVAVKTKPEDDTIAPGKRLGLGVPTALADPVDFGDDEGLGIENVSAREVMTPFLAIAQSNSKILNEGEQIYDATARAGCLYNTVTHEVYDGKIGVEILPAYRQSLYTLWTPVEAGGGFHGTRPIDDPEIAALIRDQGRFPDERLRRGFDRSLMTSDGLQVVEQTNLYVVYSTPPLEDDFGNAVIAFTSTKLAVLRNAFSTIKQIRYPNSAGELKEPPSWAHRWRVTTVPQKNKANQPFFNFALSLADGGTLKNPRPALLPPTAPAYLAARAFRDMLVEGLAPQADYNSTREPAETEAPF